MSIIVAGPLFNFLLAFLMALFIVGSIGYDAPILTGVAEGRRLRMPDCRRETES